MLRHPGQGHLGRRLVVEGEVTVTFYKNSSCSFATYYGETNAWVPTSQSGDWTTVYS